jgi:hypothetical protein
MDVSPFGSRAILSAIGIGILIISGCGNRFDLSTQRGRQARIDEANFHLSYGNCGAAFEAIEPAYQSPDVDDEIRIVRASAQACYGTFNLLNFVANIAGASNYLSAVAKSLSNSAGDGARASFYGAIDTLTRNSTLMNASARTTSVNTYMVFIQMGVVGAILRNYGAPAADGSQGSNLVYDATGSPAGEMANEDACALAASLAIITDSYPYSSLKDGDTAAFNNSVNSLCTAAGLASCSDLNKARSSCDGTNADSQRAQQVVNGVNAAW